MSQQLKSQLDDSHQLLLDALQAHNWQVAQTAAEEMSRVCRLMALEAKQRADELHSRWSDREPFSIGWAASLLYGGHRDN